MNHRLRSTALRARSLLQSSAPRPALRCRASLLPIAPIAPRRRSSTAPAFPPPDYTKYRWRASGAVHERHLVGAELLCYHWALGADGQGSGYLRFDTQLARGVPPDAFVAAARAAWLTLRFGTPIVATTTAPAADGAPALVYRAAPDHAGAAAWAARTVQLVDASALAVEHDVLAHWRVWEDGADQAVIVVLPRSDTRYELGLLLGHAWTDANGAKVAMSRFLALLARYLHEPALAEREHAQLRWGTEAANLLPAFPELVADSEKLRGPEYDATLASIMNDFVTTLPHALQYKSHAITGVEPRGHRIEYKFTDEQTRRIKQYGKKHGFTLNHLMNAAMYLSVLHDNPTAVTEDSVLLGQGAINTRNRLRAPYDERHAYPACCVGSTALPVRVADIRGVAADKQLPAVAALLKREYERQRAYPAVLGASAQQVDLILAGEAAQPSPPFSVWYYGDGIVERDLDTLYVDDAGAEVLSVVDYKLFPRYTTPDLFLRVSSWKGELYANFYYNEAYKPRQAVEGIVEDIVRMLDFSDSDA